jgi:phage/plasmid-associated DNA primase
MAKKVQNQGAPSLIAVVASGEQGTGKSLTGRFLQQILGPENCTTIGQNQLASRFTSSFAAKLFILANEVVTRENLREMSNHMKSLISDADVMLEGKGANAFGIKNSMSWWVTSNEGIPVRIEGEADRHYTIFNQPNKPSEEFKKLTRSLFSGPNFNQGALDELAGFADFLWHYKVDLDKAVEPHINDVRTEVSDASIDSVEAYCRDLEENGFDRLVGLYFPASMAFAESEPFLAGWNTAEEGGIPCQAVYAVYRRWCKRNNSDRAHAFNKFTLFVKRYRPKWANVREKKPPRRRLYMVPRDIVPA